MINHETATSRISERSNQIEKATKAVISTNGDIAHFGIVVTTKFDEFSWESRKTCPDMDKNRYILQVISPASLLKSSSINNSYVTVDWKDSHIEMIPKQDNDRWKPKPINPLV